MTPSPIIHIGYPKTGTTWLQTRAFSEHPGIEFIPAGPMMTSLTEANCDLVAVAGWLKEVQRNADRPVLMSLESLVGDFILVGDKPANVDGFTIADRLKKVAPSATILITIREQRQMLESMYRQYILGGFFKPAEKAFRTDIAWSSYLQYDQLVREYQNLYGENNLWVGTFEQFAHDPLDFLRHLWRFLGVEDIPVSSDVLSKQDNQRLSDQMMFLTKHYNLLLGRFVRSYPKIHGHALRNAKRFDKLLRRMNVAGENISFAGDVNSPETFTAGNRWLDDHFNLGLRQYGYPL